MPETLHMELADEAATLSLGARLSGLGGLIFLYGELGAGKTTFVRGFLQALGHQGAVKSPTYTLIEPYELAGRRLLHMDLYRLQSPLELEELGVREELDGHSTLLVEWPQRADGLLGTPDIELYLQYSGDARQARIVPANEAVAASLVQVISP